MQFAAKLYICPEITGFSFLVIGSHTHTHSACVPLSPDNTVSWRNSANFEMPQNSPDQVLIIWLCVPFLNRSQTFVSAIKQGSGTSNTTQALLQLITYICTLHVSAHDQTILRYFNINIQKQVCWKLEAPFYKSCHLQWTCCRELYDKISCRYKSIRVYYVLFTNV